MQNELWAIKSPDGEILHWTTDSKEHRAWRAYVLPYHPYTAEQAKADGYRAVRVKVIECEGGE